MILQFSSINVVLIGPKHAGKTVYLSALANCAPITLRDADTIALLKQHWNLLIQGSKPAATAGTLKNLSLAYSKKSGEKSYNTDLAISDYDGHFAETLSQNTSDSDERKRLREQICEAHGFIVFMPADHEDLVTMEEMRTEMGYFINTIRDVFSESEKIDALLVVAVNKWDKTDDFKAAKEDDSALAYIDSVPLYKDLLGKLQNYFSKVIVVPVSAYGHKTEDANPLPGQMDPYRVDEPVSRIVESFFDDLDARVSALQAEGDHEKLARILLSHRDLWSRNFLESYQPVLDTCLNKLYETQLEKLKQQNTSALLERECENSGYNEFCDHYTADQRAVVDDMFSALKRAERGKKVKRTFLALVIILCLGYAFQQFQFYNDFEKAYDNAINASGSDDDQFQRLLQFENGYAGARLWPGQSDKLENVRKLIDERMQTANTFFAEQVQSIAKIGDACQRRDKISPLLAGLGGRADYLQADVREQANALAKSSGEICEARGIVMNPVASQEDLEKAQQLLAENQGDQEAASLLQKLAVADEKFNHDYETRLESILKANDACTRIARLADLEKGLGNRIIRLNTGLKDRTHHLASINGNICKASGLLAHGIDKNRRDEDISRIAEAKDFLQGVENTDEVLKLRRRIIDLEEDIRVLPILDVLANLPTPSKQNGSGYDTANELLDRYKHETASKVLTALQELRATLPRRLTVEILNRLNNVSSLESSDFEDLKEFVVAQTGKIDLPEDCRNEIAREMQDKVANIDQAYINKLPDKVTSRKELDNAKNILSTLKNTDTFRLDGGIFVYDRPDKLKNLLLHREQAIIDAERALDQGVGVYLSIYLAESNAVKAGCGWTEGDDVSVNFRGSIMKINQCFNQPAGASRMTFGYTTIAPMENGYVTVTEEEPWPMEDKRCSSSISISDEEILNLNNRYTEKIEKNLGYVCPGITIEFSR